MLPKAHKKENPKKKEEEFFHTTVSPGQCELAAF